MLVSDIIGEIEEITGQCSDAVSFRAITRGVELLAAKDLFDPLIAYLDFTVGDDMTFALPRDVKAPLRLNLNGNPAFARSKLFEFAAGTDGTVDGEEIGWTWADRGRIPINDELPLPGTLSYECDLIADNAGTITVWGLDSDGREISETMTADSAAPIAGVKSFARITRVRRTPTTGECQLICNATSIIAQYYSDETVPSYRVIKVSRKNVTVRMMYRRNTYTITARTDVLPIDSAMAIIQATKAARYYLTEQYDLGAKAEEKAMQFASEEQKSRNEMLEISAGLEVQTAANRNIDTRDSIIVADIYDVAADIMGPIGRQKTFDRITDAVEALSRKSLWDSSLGLVDVIRAENSEVNASGADGNGYCVLPRRVESVVGISHMRRPLQFRNLWHEFHANGFGDVNTAPYNCADDMGEVVTIARFPLDPDTRLVIPQLLVAAPESSADDGTEVRVFGFDEDDKRLMTDDEDGILIPCVFGNYTPNPTRVKVIERITKEASTGFIRLYTVEGHAEEETFSGEARLADTEEEEGRGIVTNVADTSDFSVTDGTYDVEETYFIEAQNDDTCQIRIYAEGQATYIYEEADRDLNVTPIDTPIVITNGGATFTLHLPAEIGTGSRNFLGVLEATSSAIPSNYVSDLLLGYWEPDETEPKYKAINLPTTAAAGLRVLFRRRDRKVTSLSQPLFLRSRLAIECMLRSIKMRPTDGNAADALEAQAVKYLGEEAVFSRPNMAITFQVSKGSSPGVNRAIL